MGRRKQHCPKKATDGENEPLPAEEAEHSDSSSSVDLAMAKWIQLQAQLALRLQQQSDHSDENNKTHQDNLKSTVASSAASLPLDFSLKSSPPPPPQQPSLVSLASLMMESTSPGMTALHKMTQLATSPRSQPTNPLVNPNRFQALPMLNLPYKPLPWQSSWLMMGSRPAPTNSSMPPLPPSPALLRTLGVSEKETMHSDLFRCIWCGQAFPTMSKLGAHLKEANHGSQKDSSPLATNKKQGPNAHSLKSDSKTSATTAPRKLVRGQDVWLGKGEEQTRQILKCMWCGQSFRSLADLTTHMSETKHYTKVIPQEQLSTWRAQQQQQRTTQSPVQSSTPSPRPTSSEGYIKAEKMSHKGKKSTEIASTEKRKKALPVRKLLELERRDTVNNENDLSDANRILDGHHQPRPSSSILGSLERLVESSFKSNHLDQVAVTAAAAQAAAAHQVLLAKRAFGSVFDQDEEALDHPEEKMRKRNKTEDDITDNSEGEKSSTDIAQAASRSHWSSAQGSNSTELKFLKYSELAKELSSGR